MTRTGRLQAGIVFVAVCTACTAVYACSANVDMLFLQWNRKELPTAEIYATRLMRSSAGVRLAIRDCDAFGGSTRGWSSWVVEHNTACPETNELLAQVAADESESLARRLEACWILWRRTRAPCHLTSIFDTVREPGPAAVQIVRHRLASAVRSCELRRRIDVPASQPLELSLNEFIQAIDWSQRNPQ